MVRLSRQKAKIRVGDHERNGLHQVKYMTLFWMLVVPRLLLQLEDVLLRRTPEHFSKATR